MLLRLHRIYYAVCYIIIHQYNNVLLLGVRLYLMMLYRRLQCGKFNHLMYLQTTTEKARMIPFYSNTYNHQARSLHYSSLLCYVALVQLLPSPAMDDRTLNLHISRSGPRSYSSL